jgi:hypothetical protein
MGKLLISVGCQLIKGEGIMGIENCHLATVTVVVDSGRRHQWRLRLVGGSLTKNRNSSPTKLIHIKGRHLVTLHGRNLAGTNKTDNQDIAAVMEWVNTIYFFIPPLCNSLKSMAFL